MVDSVDSGWADISAANVDIGVNVERSTGAILKDATIDAKEIGVRVRDSELEISGDSSIE